MAEYDKHNLPPQTFTLKEVAEIIAESNKSLVAAMKQPSALEQKKLDEDLQKRKKEARMRYVTAQEDERITKGRQLTCPHTKVDKTSNWGAAVQSDGYARFICLGCGMIAPEVKAPIEWIQSGVNAQDPLNSFMRSLTLTQIKAWQDALGGPKPKTKPRGLEPLPKEIEEKINAMV